MTRVRPLPRLRPVVPVRLLPAALAALCALVFLPGAAAGAARSAGAAGAGPAAARAGHQVGGAALAAAASAGTRRPAGPRRARRVCGRPHRGYAHCDAVDRLDGGGHPLRSTAPTGLTPADVQGAYGLPVDGGTGRTVAVVDAFDDPTAEADLAAYRSAFALPACTTASGCLTVVGGDGTAHRPRPDVGWAEEISLDLDAVSAACPGCRLLLVEARSSAMADLLAAERTALGWPGVVAVSNSWGGSEPAGAAAASGAFAHPGVLVTVSSGDSGYGVEFPASASSVVAVGGTTLTVDASHRRVAETAWSGAGSGCSAAVPKPAWQRDVSCPRRAVADVAAVADPASGLAVRDTFGQPAGTGWAVVGGTSLSSPLIAAVHAAAGSTLDSPAALYATGVALHDVTSGRNGTCRPAVRCTAGPGWDGPTGLGTPDGTAGW